ncbi:MAG: hypothetical protein MK240_09145, partial [Opitutales bacterium]|nr:hypothetical protein [Opitutales bacterium]
MIKKSKNKRNKWPPSWDTWNKAVKQYKLDVVLAEPSSTFTRDRKEELADGPGIGANHGDRWGVVPADPEWGAGGDNQKWAYRFQIRYKPAKKGLGAEVEQPPGLWGLYDFNEAYAELRKDVNSQRENAKKELTALIGGSVSNELIEGASRSWDSVREALPNRAFVRDEGWLGETLTEKVEAAINEKGPIKRAGSEEIISEVDIFQVTNLVEKILLLDDLDVSARLDNRLHPWQNLDLLKNIIRAPLNNVVRRIKALTRKLKDPVDEEAGAAQAKLDAAPSLEQVEDKRVELDEKIWDTLNEKKKRTDVIIFEDNMPLNDLKHAKEIIILLQTTGRPGVGEFPSANDEVFRSKGIVEEDNMTLERIRMAEAELEGRKEKLRIEQIKLKEGEKQERVRAEKVIEKLTGRGADVVSAMDPELVVQHLAEKTPPPHPWIEVMERDELPPDVGASRVAAWVELEKRGLEPQAWEVLSDEELLQRLKNFAAKSHGKQLMERFGLKKEPPAGWFFNTHNKEVRETRPTEIELANTEEANALVERRKAENEISAITDERELVKAEETIEQTEKYAKEDSLPSPIAPETTIETAMSPGNYPVERAPSVSSTTAIGSPLPSKDNRIMMIKVYIARRFDMKEEEIRQRHNTKKHNIQTAGEDQVLFNLKETRCPYCKFNSVDYTVSTHQPAHKVDMLSHDNHQNGAYYFYCNNRNCNAFLGAIWREKSVSEMKFHTHGGLSKTDMPLTVPNVVSTFNQAKTTGLMGDETLKLGKSVSTVAAGQCRALNDESFNTKYHQNPIKLSRNIIKRI